MAAADIVVIAAAALILAGLGWFFFGPRRPRSAQLDGGAQPAVVTVRGGHNPGGNRLRQGGPAQANFDRQESGDCNPPGVLPDFRADARVPAFQPATVPPAPAN